jgi:hypothetical protein
MHYLKKSSACMGLGSEAAAMGKSVHAHFFLPLELREKE